MIAIPIEFKEAAVFWKVVVPPAGRKLQVEQGVVFPVAREGGAGPRASRVWCREERTSPIPLAPVEAQEPRRERAS